MARIQEQLADLETRIRGMAVPSQDRVWEHLRGEKATLNQLLLHDYNLIAPCRAIREKALAVTPSAWTDGDAQELEALAAKVEIRAVARRFPAHAGLGKREPGVNPRDREQCFDFGRGRHRRYVH